MNNSVLKLKSEKEATLSEIEKIVEEKLKKDSLYPTETVYYNEITKVNDSSILLMVFETCRRCIYSTGRFVASKKRKK